MFHLLPKKIFVFSTTFKNFGAETRVTEIWQASKIWPNIQLMLEICGQSILSKWPIFLEISSCKTAF